jgi:hypothetical protein
LLSLLLRSLLLPAGHLFHLQCLRAWLQQSGSDNFNCPICRLQLCVVAAPGGKASATISTTAQQLAAAAEPTQQQQRWRLQAGAPSIVGSILSMSLDVLPHDRDDHGHLQQMALHERIAATELLEAEGTGVGPPPVGPVPAPTDDLQALADALINSVQLQGSRGQQQQQQHDPRQHHHLMGSMSVSHDSSSLPGARIADDLVLTAEELAMIYGSSEAPSAEAEAEGEIRALAAASPPGMSQHEEQPKQQQQQPPPCSCSQKGHSLAGSSSSKGLSDVHHGLGSSRDQAADCVATDNLTPLPAGDC